MRDPEQTRKFCNQLSFIVNKMKKIGDNYRQFCNSKN